LLCGFPTLPFAGGIKGNDDFADLKLLASSFYLTVNICNTPVEFNSGIANRNES